MALDYSFVTQIFKYTEVFNISWLLGLIFSFFIVLLISRSKDDWGDVLFPVIICLHLLGVNQSIVIMILSGLLYVFSSMKFSLYGSNRVTDWLKPNEPKLTNKSLKEFFK